MFAQDVDYVAFGGTAHESIVLRRQPRNVAAPGSSAQGVAMAIQPEREVDTNALREPLFVGASRSRLALNRCVT